ncbi:hypothetical protein NF27_HQ00010 [Candidatus Jidaibacter acanthamoeba]|uniref:Uncharacterized protein n=1 Tax=Candidatus Jidaibacter acanthamoebae TaxID=86105 RepID=A0A0C1QJX9_9RICK|nr:hypothetical protein NF27_HQ00010 [Candidatus Jidaibacter acanthamoeba]
MNTFEHNIKSIWGKKGSSWLNSLPRLSADCAKQWGLSELTPLKNLSHNYILSGYQDSVPIILKIGLDIKQTDREANALKFYNGKGCIDLTNPLVCLNGNLSSMLNVTIVSIA